MSAIATPLIHTAAATGGENAVNIEMVRTMSKVDRPGIENQKDEFVIVFVNEDDNNRFVEWVYADSAVRDTQFDAILALASTEIV